MVGEITEEMIKQYLEHRPEPVSDFKVASLKHRSVDAHPDFQSVTQTHRILAGGCLVRPQLGAVYELRPTKI